MSDQEKFLELAESTTDKKPQNKTSKQAILAKEVTEDASQTQTEIVKGAYTQYTELGNGVAPCGPTVTKLTPDVYKIGFFNNTPILVQTNIVTDNLIRLPDSRSDELIERISKFWKLKKQYHKGNNFIRGGYLHKIGFLLFGPPGSGKTSTLNIVINQVVRDGGIVLLGNDNPAIVGKMISAIRQIEPFKNLLLVLEDFDSLIERFGEDPYLSILDGEHSIDNCLTLATTNYPSRLDPRIYNRPGRFNDVVYIGMPSTQARKTYLEHQLIDHRNVNEITELTKGFSIDHLKAVIQGVYLEGKPLRKEIQRLRLLFKPPKDNPDKQIGILQ